MKRTTSTVLAAAMLFGVVSTTAHAQTTAPNRKPFGTGELPEFLKPYDLNGDGSLSVEERQAYEKATREARPQHPGRVNPWDTDGDGVLSDAEKEAARAAIAAKIQTERTKRFNELDTNADGFLTAIELQAIPHITPEQIAAMIARLDTDADGQISLAEFLVALTPVEPPFPPVPQPPAAPPAPPCPVPPPLKPFDANNDGILSPEEYAAFVAAVDTDADGTVSLEEWKGYLLAHPELLPPHDDGPHDGPQFGPAPKP
jgi:Ca2+-binding EF-hand superfamily protein